MRYFQPLIPPIYHRYLPHIVIQTINLFVRIQPWTKSMFRIYYLHTKSNQKRKRKLILFLLRKVVASKVFKSTLVIFGMALLRMNLTTTGK